MDSRPNDTEKHVSDMEDENNRNHPIRRANRKTNVDLLEYV